MDLFDKFQAARTTRCQLDSEGINPTKVVVEEILSATEAVIDGRRTILAGTNNYLGLTFDEACIEAGQAAMARDGTGTTGSRMANGNFGAHLDLERELADFFGVPHAVVFSTGYSANLGTLAAVLGRGDVAMLDADAHASLYDGCTLSGADVFRFAHSDPESLAKRLRRLEDRAQQTLIIIEGLYSILGDQPPLKEIVDVKNEYGAYLLIDEAHSLGMLGGTGRGLAEAAGVEDDVDFLVGTFSKSLGATGGFCVSQHDILELFRYASRPYIFTASPCPSVIATTREALHQLRTRPELRETLWRHAHKLYNNLAQLGFKLGPDVSPVVGVQFDDRRDAVDSWHRLLEGGVYTNLILPPASPDGTALIRCSVTAAHTDEQVDTICDTFRTAAVA